MLLRGHVASYEVYAFDYILVFRSRTLLVRKNKRLHRHSFTIGRISCVFCEVTTLP